MENEILGLNSKVNLNCTLCEKCCEYRGDIKITPINVLQISKFLKISIDEFLEKYTEEVKGEEPEIVIKGIGDKKECIFNNRENFRCKIHKVKPMQCVVFPLVPVDLKRDLFINTNGCVLKNDKKTTVNKWLNGNHHIYSKNKNIYIKWINLMEEIQPWWKTLQEENKNEIKVLLYKDYNLNKNFEKQVESNIKNAREVFYECRKKIDNT